MILDVIVDHNDDATGLHDATQLGNNYRHLQKVPFEHAYDVTIAQFANGCPELCDDFMYSALILVHTNCGIQQFCIITVRFE